jgi:hypothetical protein
MPLYINPAEFLLDLTSSDFALDGNVAQSRVEKLHSNWESSAEASSLTAAIAALEKEDTGPKSLSESKSRARFLNVVFALLHRSFIKSYRDVVAYGIRFAMYIGQFFDFCSGICLIRIGLAIMMGTVWLRLPTTQSSIQPFINAIVSLV